MFHCPPFDPRETDRSLCVQGYTVNHITDVQSDKLLHEKRQKLSYSHSIIIVLFILLYLDTLSWLLVIVAHHHPH